MIASSGAFAQNICDGKQRGTVACLIPNVVSTASKALDPNYIYDTTVPTGDSFFVVPLTSSLPLPSPASGFVHSFSPSGAYVQSSQSFGPILAERSETIGRNKFFVGFTFQRFVFDKVDGISLHDFNSVVPFSSGGKISNNFNLGLEVNQFTTFATYGVTDRVDVSVGIPISTVYAGLTYNGSISTPATGFQPLPLFAAARVTATGIGDVNLQVKGTAIRSEHAGLALGVNIRLPTGNEYQALGAGATGIEPFVIASANLGRVSPHINLGYRRNGESVLSGNVATGVKTHIPSQVPFAAGTDIRMAKRLTLAADVLGLEVIHGDRPDPVTIVSRHSYHIVNGSAGLKVNPFGKLLFVANVLVPLNDAGMRSKIVPLIGLSYAF